jgi:hypothetical protein
LGQIGGWGKRYSVLRLREFSMPQRSAKICDFDDIHENQQLGGEYRERNVRFCEFRVKTNKIVDRSQESAQGQDTQGRQAA